MRVNLGNVASNKERRSLRNRGLYLTSIAAGSLKIYSLLYTVLPHSSNFFHGFLFLVHYALPRALLGELGSYYRCTVAAGNKETHLSDLSPALVQYIEEYSFLQTRAASLSEGLSTTVSNASRMWNDDTNDDEDGGEAVPPSFRSPTVIGLKGTWRVLIEAVSVCIFHDPKAVKRGLWMGNNGMRGWCSRQTTRRPHRPIFESRNDQFHVSIEEQVFRTEYS